MVDPDNEERLLKIPHGVVVEIKAEALDAAREAVAGIPHTYWEGIAMCRASHPSYTENDCNCPKRDALAVIDALKGDTSE